MTRHLSEPIEPFAVPARILRSSNGNDPPAGGGGRGSEGEHGSGSGEPRLPEGWNPAATDIVVGASLLGLYLVCRANMLASAAASVVLLAVLTWRLSGRGRAIAGPVLTIATVMLVTAMARHNLGTREPQALALTGEDVCMPAILAAALYFTRVRCYTVHILMVMSAALLTSGLLPGIGWMVAFVAVRYLLFFAVVLGLLIDLATSPNHQRAPAAPPIPA